MPLFYCESDTQEVVAATTTLNCFSVSAASLFITLRDKTVQLEETRRVYFLGSFERFPTVLSGEFTVCLCCLPTIIMTSMF